MVQHHTLCTNCNILQSLNSKRICIPAETHGTSVREQDMSKSKVRGPVSFNAQKVCETSQLPRAPRISSEGFDGQISHGTWACREKNMQTITLLLSGQRPQCSLVQSSQWLLNSWELWSSPLIMVMWTTITMVIQCDIRGTSFHSMINHHFHENCHSALKFVFPQPPWWLHALYDYHIYIYIHRLIHMYLYIYMISIYIYTYHIYIYIS